MNQIRFPEKKYDIFTIFYGKWLRKAIESVLDGSQGIPVSYGEIILKVAATIQ